MSPASFHPVDTRPVVVRAIDHDVGDVASHYSFIIPHVQHGSSGWKAE